MCGLWEGHVFLMINVQEWTFYRALRPEEPTAECLCGHGRHYHALEPGTGARAECLECLCERFDDEECPF